MANPGMWQSPNRLYLNRDKTRVVPAGSPEQAHVLVAAGGEIPVAEAERYGLVRVREAQVTAIEPESVVRTLDGEEVKAEPNSVPGQQVEPSQSEPKLDANADPDAPKETATAKDAPRPEPKAPASGKR